ncbi:MAG: hypothetical protein V1809_01950 [Planctomycetota bacterium]
MPSASGIRAGAAYIEMSVNDSNLIKGLQAASRKLQSFGAGLRNIGMSMMAVGAGIVTPLLASAKSFATMGNQLDKMAIRTGMSVESLSELGYAAELSGANLEDVEIGIRNMQRTIGGAAAGSESAAEALARVGLSAEQLIALSPDQQFMAIGKRLQEIKDPALRAAAAMKVFGRSGTSLLPLMDGLAEARAEARRLGVVMSSEDARAAAVFNDALDRVWASLRSLVVTVGAALAPLLTEIAGKIVTLVGAFRDWLAQNKGLVISILKIGAIVLGAGAAFVALGSILSALGTAFGAFASVVSAALGFILSPIGLVITAIAGIGGIILWATGAGGEALSWLGERFGDLKSFALESFQGIKDALAAGDVTLAARILWLSLQVVWCAGINNLKTWWLEFKDWFFQTTNDLFYGAVVLVAEAWYDLKKIWATTVNFWADVLNRFAGFFIKTWNSLIGWFAKQWTKVVGNFDSSIDVESVNKRIDEETERKNIEVSRGVFDDRIEGERELTGIEKERQQVVIAIAETADEEDQARRDQYAAEMKVSEEELAKAKDEWRAAIQEAKEKRAAMESREQPTPPPEVTPPDIGAFQEKIDAAMPELERAIQMDVVGTFTAEAANRMGVGPTAAEERTARAAEETARNTKKIAQKMEEDEALAFE